MFVILVDYLSKTLRAPLKLSKIKFGFFLISTGNSISSNWFGGKLGSETSLVTKCEEAGEGATFEFD
jgi:hypothetical protein